MVDSVAVLPWAMPILDSNGDPVAGGSIEFYDAGTTDARTVYSTKDLSTTSLGTTVALNSAGIPVNGSNTPVVIYTGNTDYRVIIKTSADVTLYTYDNIQGALDTSSFSSGGSGTYSRPRISKAADYSIVAADAGDIIIANPTGGTFTLTLPSAVTVGDGFTVGIRHDGTANQVRIAPVSSQTIDVPGANAADGYALRSMGHYIEIGSDGANWGIVDETLPLGEQSPITVIDILSSPPASPNAGDIYMLDASPSGDWSAQSQHDLAQSDGQGGWIFYTPPTDCGWLAYDQDSDTLYQFRASAWVAFTNITAPTASNLKYAVFQQRKTTNTGGDAPTATTWTGHSFSVEDVDTIGISATLPGATIPVPTGTYLVMGELSLGNVGGARVRIYNSTDAAPVVQGGNNTHTGNDVATVMGILVVTEATENIELQYHVGAGNAATAMNTGEEEIYATLTIVDLSSLQGPQGDQGTQGPTALTVSTVAGLNALSPSEGQLGYASDGRKNGEGAAAGTGVQCFYDGSAWIAVDTGATVAA